MKTGLVMEGGAMRGMFTAGVTDILMENGIEFDGAIGVSAGAAFGCNYKSRQIGRAIRYNKAYCRDPRYAGLRSLIKTGNLYGADFCYDIIPHELDLFDYKAYKENPMEFYIVCTDAHTGQAVYHHCTGEREDVQWMRASASMPLVSRLVELDGMLLSDGGIADSIPLPYFESIGYDRNLVILTQPEGFVKKRNSLIPLMRLVLRKYPKLVDALARRHEVYNDTIEYIARREKEGAALAIRPPEDLNIGKVERDADQLERVYQIGRNTALGRLDEIKEFFK